MWCDDEGCGPVNFVRVSRPTLNPVFPVHLLWVTSRNLQDDSLDRIRHPVFPGPSVFSTHYPGTGKTSALPPPSVQDVRIEEQLSETTTPWRSNSRLYVSWTFVSKGRSLPFRPDRFLVTDKNLVVFWPQLPFWRWPLDPSVFVGASVSFLAGRSSTSTTSASDFHSNLPLKLLNDLRLKLYDSLYFT